MNKLQKLLDAGHGVELSKTDEGYVAMVMQAGYALSTGIASDPDDAVDAAAAGLGGEWAEDEQHKLTAAALLAVRSEGYAQGYQAGIAAATPLDMYSKWCADDEDHEKCTMAGICDCGCHAHA
jgi:hypothetical protein